MASTINVDSISRVFLDDQSISVRERPLNKKSYSREKNILKNGNNVFIDLSPGYDYEKFKKKEIRSISLNENKVLQNKKYKVISDSELLHINVEGQQKIFPYYDYNDVDSIKRKNKVVDIPFNVSLGINNNSDFIDYKSRKFKDIDDKTKYLIDSNDEEDVSIYPWLLNDYDIDSRGANIDILGTISEIKRDSLFITNIKGFKVSFCLNDMRKRNILIQDYVDFYNISSIENFLEYREDIILYSRDSFSKLGKFEKITVNGKITNKFNPLIERSIESLNHELAYISNEKNTYTPFKDREEKYAIFQEFVDPDRNPRLNMSNDFKDYYTNSTWNENTNNSAFSPEKYFDGIVYSSHGRDFDYSISNGIDSLAFAGGLD